MELIAELLKIMFILIMLGTLLLIAVGYYALTCIGRMKMFRKAGTEAWKAWVPFYRDYVLCELCMGKGWYFVFGLIPVLSIFMRAVYALEVTLSYGQNMLFGILYYFFPVIAELIAGFGGCSYKGSQDLEEQVKRMFQDS